MSFPAGGSLKLVELGPNVQHAQGGGANNLIVVMKDHLVMFDAPYGEANFAHGDRSGQGQVSGQADQVSGSNPSPYRPSRWAFAPMLPRARPSS